MILLANACQGLTSVVSKIKMDTKEVSSFTPAPSKGKYRAGGRDHTLNQADLPVGTISCRETAPLSD
jgi:hypothetical protein